MENNTKKCIECGKEYESTNRTGHEQKYCSKICRNRSSYKRRESNLFEKLSGQIQQKPIENDEREKNYGNNEYNFAASNYDGFKLSSERVFELVSTNANLTAENKRLEDKIEQLQKDYNQLEFEFAELEESIDENESKNSMISGINNITEKVTPFLPIILEIFSKSKPQENNGKNTQRTTNKNQNAHNEVF